MDRPFRIQRPGWPWVGFATWTARSALVDSPGTILRTRLEEEEEGEEDRQPNGVGSLIHTRRPQWVAVSSSRSGWVFRSISALAGRGGDGGVRPASPSSCRRRSSLLRASAWTCRPPVPHWHAGPCRGPRPLGGWPRTMQVHPCRRRGRRALCLQEAAGGDPPSPSDAAAGSLPAPRPLLSPEEAAKNTSSRMSRPARPEMASKSTRASDQVSLP